MSYGNNGYGRGNGYGGGRNQRQQNSNGNGNGQGGDYWPKATGFNIGPSKRGTGQVVQFTLNADQNQRSKNKSMLFHEFMEMAAKAFDESGGFGVRIVIPFHEAEGRRGDFLSGTINVFPNMPPQDGAFGGRGQGNGRRSYPQQGGYQPRETYPPGRDVPQDTRQSGPMNHGAPTPAYQQAGPGPNAQNNAFPSDDGDGPNPEF